MEVVSLAQHKDCKRRETASVAPTFQQTPRRSDFTPDETKTNLKKSQTVDEKVKKLQVFPRFPRSAATDEQVDAWHDDWLSGGRKKERRKEGQKERREEGEEEEGVKGHLQ